MKYFSIVGNTPHLSMAEIESVLNRREIAWKWAEISQEALWIETDGPVDWLEFLPRLGGVLKAGRALASCVSEDELSSRIEQWVRAFGVGRFRVGVSVYRAADEVAVQAVERAARRIRTMLLTIKKEVRVDDIRFRMVTSHERALSSVVVETNNMLERGGELCVFVRPDGLFDLGVTEAVQDFKAYRLRDIGRPRRNAKRGMLPPKLAQMMVNIAGVAEGGIILDPFCGSGTVLQEALLLGCNIIGSDISADAVQDTKENLYWLAKQYNVNLKSEIINPPAGEAGLQLYTTDIRSLTRYIPLNSVDAIVTEPWLGPPQTGRESPRDLGQIRGQVSGLIVDAFGVFDSLLKPNGTVVMVIPVIGDERLGLTGVERLGWKIDALQKEQDTIIYKRPDQHVAREIVRLKKTIK